MDAQIALTKDRLTQLDSITLNIGQHVADTLGTMFNGLISGTLKGVDILKAATGLIGNIVTDIFGQMIKKKLSFETTLFTNLRGLAPQMQSAFAAGGGAPDFFLKDYRARYRTE
jgi:hypothetical protein